MMNVIEVVEITKLNPWFGVLCCVLTGISFVAALCIPQSNSFRKFLISVVILIISLGALMYISVNIDDPVFRTGTGKFQVKATFTDDMPFNTVMKEYDVVGQDGFVFTLEPKNRLVAEGMDE